MISCRERRKMTLLDQRLAKLRVRLADEGVTEIIEWGIGDEQLRLEAYGRCSCGDLYRHRTAATVVAGQIHLASESVCPSCDRRMQQVRDWNAPDEMS
jgi:hypothetical protein